VGKLLKGGTAANTPSWLTVRLAHEKWWGGTVVEEKQMPEMIGLNPELSEEGRQEEAEGRLAIR